MNYTTNYNFMLPEGTDLVNYLTQTNPNFTSLDTLIKAVSDATVTTATEVTSGTAHAISRTLPDANVIRFTATSNWLTGDTMTIDGTPVTVLKTDGTSLKTGDYIIGSGVLGILDSTRFTVLVASSPDANDITYDNTGSGLTANKVQGAIDELSTDVDTLDNAVNSVLTWHYLDTITGNVGVDLPANFTELYISSYLASSPHKRVLYVPKVDLSATAIDYLQGGGSSTSTAGWAVSQTRARLTTFILNGTQYRDSVSTSYWYR